MCVVTKHVDKLKKIEKQILEETGTVITVMNNKRKSLAKAKMIINLDFPQEFISQYTIYEKATIVDVNNNIKNTKKRFEGIVLQDYEICVRNEYIIEEQIYLKKDLYEAEFYKRQPYEYVREKIRRDRVKIIKLMR